MALLHLTQQVHWHWDTIIITCHCQWCVTSTVRQVDISITYLHQIFHYIQTIIITYSCQWCVRPLFTISIYNISCNISNQPLHHSQMTLVTRQYQCHTQHFYIITEFIRQFNNFFHNILLHQWISPYRLLFRRNSFLLSQPVDPDVTSIWTANLSCHLGHWQFAIGCGSCAHLSKIEPYKLCEN